MKWRPLVRTRLIKVSLLTPGYGENQRTNSGTKRTVHQHRAYESNEGAPIANDDVRHWALQRLTKGGLQGQIMVNVRTPDTSMIHLIFEDIQFTVVLSDSLIERLPHD
jgi:hypothetical protein